MPNGSSAELDRMSEMRIEPYNKHQLYRGRYVISKGGMIGLPDKCYWIVKKYTGTREFAEVGERGEIALMLNEDYGGDRGYWSVISFLTADEAKELASQLAAATSRIEEGGETCQT